MENTARSAHSEHAGPAPAPGQAAGFRVRWGRTVLALVGLMAVAAFATGTLLALFGALPGSVPLLALLTVAAVVVFLRRLAVRDRRQRARARAAKAGTGTASRATEPEQPVRHRETVLFNADAVADGKAAPAAPAPLSAEQLRAEALKVAAAAAAKASGPAAGVSGPAWQPVELPKPTYIDAAKAERPAPEPLPAPEVKKPTTKTYIKQDAALKAPAAAAAAVPAGQDSQDGHPRPQAGKLNLDAVLQRRRA
ncbi:hypothetical protein ACFQ36_11285 [Arthrobacter sp. GCM10027362]|uniref:hypothetical protein n=1 Tax=Arthrobacter sp. GCM10027362 TaxID=3273379 RepID=UPI003626D689